MALTAARKGGDAVSMARILGNQSYALLAAAQCDQAVTVSREAVLATKLVRPMGALTAALHNLAEALTRVGEYDEARWHLRRAAAVDQQLGPNRAAASLCGLGDVYRALGLREQGRAAYEEAVALARTSHELSRCWCPHWRAWLGWCSTWHPTRPAPRPRRPSSWRRPRSRPTH